MNVAQQNVHEKHLNRSSLIQNATEINMLPNKSGAKVLEEEKVKISEYKFT